MLVDGAHRRGGRGIVHGVSGGGAVEWSVAEGKNGHVREMG